MSAFGRWLLGARRRVFEQCEAAPEDLFAGTWSCPCGANESEPGCRAAARSEGSEAGG